MIPRAPIPPVEIPDDLWHSPADQWARNMRQRERVAILIGLLAIDMRKAAKRSEILPAVKGLRR